MTYQFRTLTSAVKDQQSPLRVYLAERFPNTKPIQAEYKRTAGALLVPAGRADPGTLGAAFDYYVRFTLDRSYAADLATKVFGPGANQMALATRESISIAQRASVAGEQDVLFKACWVCALATEIYRNPAAMVGSPLRELGRRQDVTTRALLELAPADALDQLRTLSIVAEENLFPELNGDLHLGPTFDASELCPADADLISGGLLLDLKTHLGKKNSQGARYDALALAELYQVIGYLLFDRSDRYGIDRVGIYSARYGNLVAWDVNHVLSVIADGPVDLASEREHVWALLGS